MKVHFKQIDGLRFVAIALVLISHFASVIGRTFSAGYYGVDLFFVISGFLITQILLSQQGAFFTSYKKFLGRRVLRIFPLYYLMLLGLIVLGHGPVKQHWIYFATFTYNYAQVSAQIPVNAMSHFWSLAVEEQFYFFWPILVLLLKSRPKWLFLVILLIAVLCSFQLFFEWIPVVNKYNRVGLFPQANSLSLGAIGAYLFMNNLLSERIFQSRVLEYLALMSLLMLLCFGGDLTFIFCPVISLYFVLKCCVGGFRIPVIDGFLSRDKIVYWGSISYGIYVFHFPLAYYANVYFFNPYFWNLIDFDALGSLSGLKSHPWIVRFPLYSVLSVLVAHYSYQCFEKPILGLKDRYFKY